MRIESIEAIPVEIPLRRNFGGSTYAVLKRSTIVTRLRTDDGLVGEVYNGDNREHGAELAPLVHEALAVPVTNLIRPSEAGTPDHSAANRCRADGPERPRDSG
jgi:L-alanine-DL-glutamate epimerase-like enolase superfamily enzyme